MTPEQALALAKVIADVYADATTRILETIARQTARGMSSPDWARERLAEVALLRRNSQRIVSAMQEHGATKVLAVLEDAYRGGRLTPLTQPGLTAVNQRSVAALAAETTRALESTGPVILRWAEDTYRTVVAEATGPLIAGVEDRRATTARMLDRYATLGVTGFTDTAGRRWSLDTYAEMTARTAAGRAHLEGTLDRIRDAGGDLVIVSNSPEECGLCRPFEGTLLTLSGAVPAVVPEGFRFMGSLAAARDAGLFHPNCTHRVDRFIPGLTKPVTGTANPTGDRNRQRQRALERAVRDAKRRTATLTPLGQSPQLTRTRALLRARQERLRVFNEANNRKQWVSTQRTSVNPNLDPPPPRIPDPTPNPDVPSSKSMRRTRVEVTPRGTPTVGDAVTIAPSTTARISDAVQEALTAIDAVHGDGNLPGLPIRSTKTNDYLGAYFPAGGGIRISNGGITPQLTTVHEVGHFLDHQGLGQPGVFATETGLDLLNDWRTAYQDTAAVRQLRAIDPAAYGAQASAIRSHIQYLLDPVEVWGRSYAQYVAVRSGRRGLLDELDTMIERGRSNGITRQWEHDDFADLADVIDDLLRRRGWQT